MYYGDLYCYVSPEDPDLLDTLGNEEQRLHWCFCECRVQEHDFCRYCYETMEEHTEIDPQRKMCTVVYYTVYKNPFYHEWNTPRSLVPDLYHQIEHHFRATCQTSCHFWKYGIDTFLYEIQEEDEDPDNENHA